MALAIIASAGTFELLRCAGLSSKYAVSVPAVLLVFLMLMLARGAEPLTIGLIALMFLLYLLFVLIFSRKNCSASDISVTFFFTSYAAVSFSSILLIRELENGEYLYLLVFIAAWVTDTFAYFTGKFLGRHKLMPVISPKKTIEGSIGGIIFCAGAFILYGYVISSIRGGAVPDYLLLGLAGVVTSVVAQLGDLSASAIKRGYNIDDFGTIFPGHGGVIDRFDSVMAVGPFIFIICSLLIKFENIGLFI